MRALSKRDSVYSIGNQIGVGKESGTVLLCCLNTRSSFLIPRLQKDIYIVADAEGHEMVLKLHRFAIFVIRLIQITFNFLFSIALDVSLFVPLKKSVTIWANVNLPRGCTCRDWLHKRSGHSSRSAPFCITCTLTLP